MTETTCLPDARADGLSRRAWEDRKHWLHTAVGAEAMGRGENWSHTYESYIDSGRGWAELVTWWSNAAQLLAGAVYRWDSPDVDLVLTVERYVSSIYTHFNREHRLPYQSELLKLAAQAVTD
jgi:hypothetical protein